MRLSDGDWSFCHWTTTSSVSRLAFAHQTSCRQNLAAVRGGYTNARTHATMVNGTAIESGSRSQSGWLAGGGVERQVAQNLTARLEYRYSKFGEGDGKDYRHRVLAGLADRF
jgi:outer membrane immunogenic protein